MSTHETHLEYTSRIAAVLQALQRVASRGAAAPPIDELASIANFSKAHFMRVFASMVGETVGEHLRRLRLERAAGELLRTNHQVIRIALRCGYQAHEPFTRAFTEHFGMSPSAYRALIHPTGPIASRPLIPAHPHAPSHVYYGGEQVSHSFVPIFRRSSMFEVTVTSSPARRLFAVHHRGPYNEISKAFGKLGAWAGPRGYFGPGTECIGVYHDSPKDIEPSKLRSDACLTAPSTVGADEASGISILELPAGTYAVGVFKGPYTRLGEAWDWLYGSWLAGSGHEPAEAPAFEVYLNNPQHVNPEECLTALHVPLK
jgi:AraC family transcriptional regulator